MEEADHPTAKFLLVSNFLGIESLHRTPRASYIEPQDVAA